MAYFDIKEGVAIIPDGTTEICDYAFAGCSELVSVVIPDSVTKIGYAAFAYCENLEYVTIPESVRTIEYYAFSNCKNLICVYCKSLVPPSGGYEMFHFSNDEYNVKTYPIFCQICVPQESIEAYRVAEWWCKYGNNIYGYDFNQGEFTDVTIPSKPLNNEIWYANGSTTEPTLPWKETAFNGEIVSNLYYFEMGCWVLKFNCDVTSIEYSAFANCENITAIILPNSIKKISVGAFSGCTKLNGIYCTSAKPPKISSSILSKYKVYVPIAAVETYMQARGWKKYNNNIVGYDFEKGR